MDEKEEKMVEAGFAANPLALTGTGVYWTDEGSANFELLAAPKPIIRRQIWVTFQKEGIHKYPAALTDPALAEVSFLGYPHRHMFHFEVKIDVVHNDRDIEFILLKRELEKLYEDGTMQLDYKSCEMLAEELINYIVRAYPNRVVEVTVSEDGENGATLTYLG